MTKILEAVIKTFISFAAVTIDTISIPAKIFIVFMMFLHSAYENEIQEREIERRKHDES